jgi:glycosyltransferase involved in cell wall biosynthesis
MQKVLQICHGHQGPFLNVTQFYTRGLQANGKQVKTVFLKGKAIDDKAVYLDTPTRKLRGLKLGLLRRLREIISQQQPALIIAHRFKAAYLALWASLFSATPVVMVVHAHDVFKRPYRQWLARLFKKRLQIFAVSKGIAENIRHDLGSTLPIATLHNCIDVPAIKTAQVDRSAARTKLSLDNNDFIIACVGRIHSDKDPLTLTRAFAQVAKQMPNAKLVFIGGGKLEASLRELITSLHMQERVLMLGQVANAYQYFKAFDMFALASTLEPFGMVFLEAMAANVPVITSRTDGGLEVVSNAEQLFTIADVQDCAEKLLASYQWSTEKRSHIAQLAQERLQAQFSQAAFNKQLGRQLASLLNR